MKLITKLIDESINIKKEILNGDIFKLIEDEKKVQNINKKIDSVNTIYNKINNFSIIAPVFIILYVF